jgi:eukaryotic-like serine/threonine-protein kinase
MALNADDLVGQTLGEYQLDRVLGTGGSGIVYLAHLVAQPEQQVALKLFIPPPHLHASEQELLRKRFLQEARTLMRLHHPHIVAVQALGEHDGLGGVYLVMPYLAGGTLDDRLQQGPLTLAEVQDAIRHLADALDYAHANQVIHRDIKPANVLFDEQGQIYLADFGSAKLLDTTRTALTTANQIIGTPGYMAPEQMSDQPITPATDVYGLGILAYHMITGHLPFESESLMALFRQITLDEPASPRDLRPDLPAPAAAAIVRALAKMPEQRFPSADAFALALERGMQNKPLTPSPHSIVARFAADEGEGLAQPDATPSTWLSSPRKHQLSRRALALIAAALLFVLVSTGLLFARLGSPTPAAKTAGELTQIATATQGMAATNAAQGTTLPAGGSPPKNKATQVAIATQVASGTQIPTATGVPGSTQVPHPTSAPAPTKIPTATPQPGELALIGDQNPTLPETNFNGTSYCGRGISYDGSFALADITLTNTGGSTLNWTSSYTINNGNGSGYATYNPTSGTIPPGGKTDISYTDGNLAGGEIMFVTFTGPANLITEGIYCG